MTYPSEPYLRAMSEASHDPITMIRSDDTIILWSPAAERVFGFSAAEAIGRKFHELIVPEHYHSQASAGLERFARSGTGPVVGTVSEFEARCKDGSLIPVERSVSACLVDGQWHAVGILRDISERKKAEQKLRAAYEQIRQQQEIISHDLQTAAKIQETLLPFAVPPSPYYELAWFYRPSALIGGDIFSLTPLAEGKTAIYMIDVSGHGVSAALVSASVAQFLRQKLAASPDISPTEIVRALDAEYPLERFDKFFTIIFMVYDPAAGTISSCNAGHPPGLLIRRDQTVHSLDVGGPPVGLGDMLPFHEEVLAVNPDDLLCCYTDGAMEVEDQAGEQLGMAGLTEVVRSRRDEAATAIMAGVEAAVMGHAHGPPADDVTCACLKLKKISQPLTSNQKELKEQP